MKTILINENNRPIKVDPSTLEVFDIDSQREAISKIVIIEEDCVVKYKDVEKQASAGDLLIIFYELRFPHKFILVKNDEWLENITTYNNIRKGLFCEETNHTPIEDDCINCEAAC